jgi:N-formylglutamate amidohydrolase
MTLPIIYSAHHASYCFGGFNDRVALDFEQRKRFSDLGTDLTVPRNGLLTLIAPYSRGIVDLNTDDDNRHTIHPSRDFKQPDRNDIWKAGMELTESEKEKIRTSVYNHYHDDITDCINIYDQNCLVVAWDNTAHYVIGKNEAGEDQMMVPIVLSNQGDEGKTTGESPTCKPELLEALGSALSKELAARSLPSEVYYNLVFKGGNVARTHTNFSRPNPKYPKNTVQSLQIEYDMIMTHDLETLELKSQNVFLLKEAFEAAIEKVAHLI